MKVKLILLGILITIITGCIECPILPKGYYKYCGCERHNVRVSIDSVRCFALIVDCDGEVNSFLYKKVNNKFHDIDFSNPYDTNINEIKKDKRFKIVSWMKYDPIIHSVNGDPHVNYGTVIYNNDSSTVNQSYK